MSTWTEITSQNDIELSDDGKTIEVWLGYDEGGNIYVEIPIEFIENALKNNQ